MSGDAARGRKCSPNNPVEERRVAPAFQPGCPCSSGTCLRCNCDDSNYFCSPRCGCSPDRCRNWLVSSCRTHHLLLHLRHLFHQKEALWSSYVLFDTTILMWSPIKMESQEKRLCIATFALYNKNFQQQPTWSAIWWENLLRESDKRFLISAHWKTV